MEPKNWYNLPDVANILDSGATQLVKLVKEHGLPLHVRPHNWYAHLWTYARNEGDELYKFIEFNHNTFQCKSELSKPARPDEPLALSKRDIEVLANKGTISENIFIANDTVKSDGSIVAYFKLCDPQDYKKDFLVSISLEDVLIRNDCFEKIKEIVSVKPLTKPITENQKDKLYRMIGLLALLLSKKAPKYSNDDKPNFKNISEDLLKELEEIAKENKIETLGLGHTNLRNAMSEGIKLLHGKKI